jgi:hypothetical protein
MSSTTHVKRMLVQLLNISGHELGHKIIVPNNNTVILYDVPEWDETMHAWVRQKLPGCTINILSMPESISGFAVIFYVTPPTNGVLPHLLNIVGFLLLCATGFMIFSRINALTSTQQKDMYDHSYDTNSYNIHHDAYRPKNNSSFRTTSEKTPIFDQSRDDHLTRKTGSVYRSTPFEDTTVRKNTGKEIPTQQTLRPDDIAPPTTIASAVVAPMIESLFGSLFRQAVDAWGWPVVNDINTNTVPTSNSKESNNKESNSKESKHKEQWELDNTVPEPYWISSKRKVRDF